MSRKVFFSSAHLYKQETWSEKKNTETFGKCYSQFGHGHNYILEAYFEGPINLETGLLVNLIDIDPLLKAATNQLDHKHLNFDVEFFKTQVPTTENIASFIWNEIQRQLAISYLKNISLYKIKLFEEPDLWVEMSL